MARKRIEPITSLGDKDKLTVQKSLPLFALWRSGLTLAEFKILDTYLSRIDSHKPDKRAVMFEKGEIEKIIGVKKINNQDLKMRLEHLMSHVVEVTDSSAKKGFKLVTLFEEAVAEQDEYGLWQVKMECTQKAMKYFFNVENLGYLRYKLRCIMPITSRYTYIMFLYLEANRYRKDWNVELDYLKHILDCDKEELYKEYKFFNQKILKRAHKELLEKTECRYSYEPVKKGRYVVAIHFTVETLADAIEKPANDASSIGAQITIEQMLTAGSKTEELWKEPLLQFGFTQPQYKELFDILVLIPEGLLPAGEHALDLKRYHYLEQKANELVRRDAEKPIRNKYAYLLKIVKNDAL